MPYLDFLAPGIIAQSALFVAIFYGIQIIWERDAGVLTKLLVTPTPRVGAGRRQGVRGRASGRSRRWSSCSSLAALLGRRADLRTRSSSLGAFVVVMLGAAFFACLSMTIAGSCSSATG